MWERPTPTESTRVILGQLAILEISSKVYASRDGFCPLRPVHGAARLAA